MTESILSSLGLTLDNITSFGFTGTSAAAAFGDSALTSFLAAEAGLTNIPTTNLDFDALLDLAQRSGALTGNGADAQQQLLDVNTLLEQQTGSGLGDISFGTDANGNITASLDGVEGATNTLNINDLLGQALDMIG